MADELRGFRVAILVDNGFEEIELFLPRSALEEAGAQTLVVSPREPDVRGWNDTDWGQDLSVDVPLTRAQPDDYNALLLPGGLMNADKLRTQPLAIEFVKSFFDAGRPVAAICHSPWIVIEAGAARGRRMTSWPSLQTDLRNAGATWVDEKVVVDGHLVSSRTPDDIPAFNRKMVRLFHEASVHAGHRT